tara:strand:- start:212 stop:649 length:438 start_codon:yes stop_codon:yes gene_type:complete
MGKKKAGKEAGSKLLRALGRTKKEQLKALTPPGLKKARTSTSVKSKAPYTRGKVMGAGDLITRRATIGGTKSLPAPTKKKGIGIADVIGAGAAGWAVGSGQHKKLAKAVSGRFKKEDTHLDKARKGAKELIKKQKTKKEKRKSHH